MYKSWNSKYSMLKDKNFASSMIRAVIIHLVKYCTRKLLLGLWSLCKKSLCHPSRKFQPTWTTEIQILNMLLLLLLVKKSIIHPSIVCTKGPNKKQACSKLFKIQVQNDTQNFTNFAFKIYCCRNQVAD